MVFDATSSCGSYLRWCQCVPSADLVRDQALHCVRTVRVPGVYVAEGTRQTNNSPKAMHMKYKTDSPTTVQKTPVVHPHYMFLPIKLRQARTKTSRFWTAWACGQLMREWLLSRWISPGTSSGSLHNSLLGRLTSSSPWSADGSFPSSPAGCLVPRLVQTASALHVHSPAAFASELHQRLRNLLPQVRDVLPKLKLRQKLKTIHPTCQMSASTESRHPIRVEHH